MTDEEKAKMKELEEQVVSLTKERDTATSERDGFKTDNEKLGKDIIAKDKIIEQKTKDIVGVRKLAERSKEELEGMTEAEKDALKLAEQNAAELDSIKKGAVESATKQRESQINAAIVRYAGKNPDLAKKIRENLSRLNPEDVNKASTPEEIGPLVDTAWNMLGNLKPNPIASKMGGSGGDAPDGSEKKDFADTPEGQALAAKIAPAAVVAPAK